MLNIVICEDNSIERDYIRRLVEEIVSEQKLDIKVCMAAGTPDDVLKYTNKYYENNNIYILDIDYNTKFSGLDVAKIIREKDTKAYIIFVTGHMEYVMLSFKMKTFDYLVKPVNKKIMQNTLMSIVNDYTNLNKSRKISIKFGGEIRYVNEDDIIYVEKMRTLLIIHSKGGDIRIYESLNSFQDKVDSNKFVRTHRSYLVNTKYIDKISMKDSLIYMANGDKCYISRNQKKRMTRYEDNL